MPAKKYSERKREEREAANSEAAGVILIIISAFLLLCMLTRGLILGDIGRAIANVLTGVIGYVTYPLLLFMLILGILKVQKRKLSVRMRYAVWVSVIAFAIICIAHLATSYAYMGNGFNSYASEVYSNKNTVGGVIFGVIVYAFYAVMGTVFTYIVFSLLIVAALFFMSGFYANLPVVKRADRKRRNKNVKKSTKGFVTDASYGLNGFSDAENRGGGLFVGSIIKPDVRYSRSGSFDDIPDTPEIAEEQKPEVRDEIDTEKIYDRERARKILFEDNKEAYERYLPSKATAQPVVKYEKEEKQVIPEVPVPPEKYFEQNYVAGEIINGDEVAARLSDKNKANETKSVSDYSFSSSSVTRNDSDTSNNVINYTKSTATRDALNYNKTEEENTPYFNPGPIINGDFFVEGEEAPVVKMFEEQPSGQDISSSEEPSVNSDSDGQYSAANDVADFEDKSDYSTNNVNTDTYAASDSEPQINVYYHKEEQPSLNNEQPSFGEIGVNHEENNYSNLVDELENESLDFETEVAEPQPEKIETQSVYEAYDDLEDIDGEKESEALSETSENTFEEAEDIPGAVAEEKKPEETETELSKKFESSTSSFNISEEVEDLSEKSFSNPNDTTGYYNVASKSAANSKISVDNTFEKRVNALDEKLNPSGKLANQIDIDTFSHQMAKKQASDEVKPKPKKHAKYVAPPIDLLVTESMRPESDESDTNAKIATLENTLEEFGVPAKVNGVTYGPAITRYELDMPPGMSVRKIESLAPDIMYSMKCSKQIRIQSPIPGKRAVGIELPNDIIYTVALKDIINSSEFKASPSPLTIALGKDIQGKVMLARLDKMPHLLIAGTTGSGKSACINSLLISLLYKASPQDVRIILVDPKLVEFTAYNGLPHLMIPNAITNVNQAINAFKWAVEEMERRYETLRENQVRDIQEYNSCTAVKEGAVPKMPFIVLVVDEFADLITSSQANRKILEDYIMRITSKARAAGIHLVLATQRPSVDVITGTIKANLPSRIAFAVASAQNSRIILDDVGAEALLGRGDMLFAPVGESDAIRIQGAFVQNDEVKNIVNFVNEHNQPDFNDDFEKAIVVKDNESEHEGSGSDENGPYDNELIDVVRCVIKAGMASSSFIQRRFRFGWNKAARIMEQMEELHFIGPQNNSKPREVYITKEKFKEFFGEDYEE